MKISTSFVRAFIIKTNPGEGDTEPGFQKNQTPNAMKKNDRISDLFGVLCVFAVFAGCVERLDGGVSWWTVSCLAVAVVFGLVSKYTSEESKPNTNKTNRDE